MARNRVARRQRQQLARPARHHPSRAKPSRAAQQVRATCGRAPNRKLGGNQEANYITVGPAASDRLPVTSAAAARVCGTRSEPLADLLHSRPPIKGPATSLPVSFARRRATGGGEREQVDLSANDSDFRRPRCVQLCRPARPAGRIRADWLATCCDSLAATCSANATGASSPRIGSTEARFSPTTCRRTSVGIN